MVEESEGAIPWYVEDETYYYPSHKASDGYHCYVEDIALMAEIGL